MKDRQCPAYIPMWTFLLEPEAMYAATALIKRGVDANKLKRLLLKQKRGPKPKGAKKPKSGKKGRPRKWTDEERRTLIEIVDSRKGKATIRMTDKAALQSMLNESAERHGARSSHARNSYVSAHLKSWQNQLSIGRMSAAKNPEKAR